MTFFWLVLLFRYDESILEAADQVVGHAMLDHDRGPL
jgi:hypothetical protein